MLNVSAGYLLVLIDTPRLLGMDNSLSPSERLAVNMYRELSDEWKEVAMAMISNLASQAINNRLLRFLWVRKKSIGSETWDDCKAEIGFAILLVLHLKCRRSAARES